MERMRPKEFRDGSIFTEPNINLIDIHDRSVTGQFALQDTIFPVYKYKAAFQGWRRFVFKKTINR